MAFTVCHMVLSSHVVVFGDSLGSTLFHSIFLNLHSCLPSIPIHALGGLSFIFLCSCCASAVVSVPIFEKELLFFYLSLQSHQSFPAHFLLTSITSCFAPLLFSCVASPVLCMPSTPTGVHTLMLQPVCLLWMYTMACSLKCWWFLCLYPFLQFLVLCFVCGYYGIACSHGVYMCARLVYYTQPLLVVFLA